jgi:hypothetical protein
MNFRMHLDWISKAGYGFDSIPLWSSAIDIHLRSGDPNTAGKLLQLANSLPLNPNIRSLSNFAEHASIAHLNLASVLGKYSNSTSALRRAKFQKTIKSFRHPFTIERAEVDFFLFSKIFIS